MATFARMPDNLIDNSLQRYFDKVWVVTVPRFRDRHARVTQRLEGIRFSFFNGADKNDLTPEKIREVYRYDKTKTLAPGYYFKPMNTGEIACSLSHRMLYEEMIRQQYQHVLVLEDDVVPDPRYLAQLDDYMQELPPDWELCYLGYLKNERPGTGKKWQQYWYRAMAFLGLSKMPAAMIRRFLPEPYSPHLWKAGFHDCTHAYAISLGAAKKLVAAQSPVLYRADNLLTALVLKGELKAFACKQFLFNQEVFTDTSDRSQIREKWAHQ